MDQSVFERVYSKVFTIPKKRISVTLGIITIVFASLQYGLAREFFARRYIALGLILIILILILGRTIKLAFNGRRTFFLALLILISIEIFDFIAFHFGTPYLISLTPALISSFLTIILYFLSEANEDRVYAVSLIMILLIYPFNYRYSFDAPSRLDFYILTLTYIFIASVGVFLGYLYIRFLDRDFGFNLKDLLRSFTLFWLTSNPAYVEKELDGTGMIKEGWIRCLSIGNVKIISDSFHPGPFGNVGGAKLVKRILDMGNTMYLHSASTHGENIVSGEEAEKLMDSITCNCKELRAMKPYEVESKKFKITVFPFDNFRLMIVSGKNAIDDIPPEVQEFADKFGDILVCDAHNSYKKGYDVTPDEVEEIKSLIEKATGIETEESTVMYSFSKRKVDTTNICRYLALLILDYEGEKYAVFMIDSNNIEKTFRLRVERFLEDKKVKAIVISPDDHAKTGILPKLGYEPAGADKSDVRAVFDFLKEIDFKNVKEKGKISYCKKDVKAKVIGSAFFENLERAVIQMGGKAMFLFFLIIFLQLTIAVILGTLLF
ncbi:MAG: DUF2070 family protein [Thermoplasmata archaeon]|nr:DUF2070 family protein [Thermoplasmata archaeon]